MTGRDVAGAPPHRSGEVWTVPNVLSMLRLVGVPLFGWLILTGQDGWAVAVLAVSGVTDYLDGKIARRYGLITRLGAVLDPLADRLYIVSTLLGLGYRGFVPWWLVGLLLARDVLIAVLAGVVRGYRLPTPPVDFVGKAATFNLLYAFPLLLLGHGADAVAHVAHVVGWAFAWWGVALYWTAGVVYTLQVARMVAARRQLREAIA